MAMYTKCSRCRNKILKGTTCECSKERYKEYDKRVRYHEDNKKYADFYNSSAWQMLSEHIKVKYNGICLICLLKYNEIVPVDVSHHIEPIRDSWDKRFEEDNLIPLCHACHNNIDHTNYTEDQKKELRKLLVVYKNKYI